MIWILMMMRVRWLRRYLSNECRNVGVKISLQSVYVERASIYQDKTIALSYTYVETGETLIASGFIM